MVVRAYGLRATLYFIKHSFSKSSSPTFVLLLVKLREAVEKTDSMLDDDGDPQSISMATWYRFFKVNLFASQKVNGHF